MDVIIILKAIFKPFYERIVERCLIKVKIIEYDSFKCSFNNNFYIIVKCQIFNDSNYALNVSQVITNPKYELVKEIRENPSVVKGAIPVICSGRKIINSEFCKPFKVDVRNQVISFLIIKVDSINSNIDKIHFDYQTRRITEKVDTTKFEIKKICNEY